MRRLKDLVLVFVYVTLLVSVAVLHFGCEEGPTGPDCGPGPFQMDAKTGICRSLATGDRVDVQCCQK